MKVRDYGITKLISDIVATIGIFIFGHLFYSYSYALLYACNHGIDQKV